MQTLQVTFNLRGMTREEVNERRRDNTPWEQFLLWEEQAEQFPDKVTIRVGSQYRQDYYLLSQFRRGLTHKTKGYEVSTCEYYAYAQYWLVRFLFIIPYEGQYPVPTMDEEYNLTQSIHTHSAKEFPREIAEARRDVLYALWQVYSTTRRDAGLCARLEHVPAKNGMNRIRVGAQVVILPLQCTNGAGYAYYSGDTDCPVMPPDKFRSGYPADIEAQAYYREGVTRGELYQGEQYVRREALRQWLIQFYRDNHDADEVLRELVTMHWVIVGEKL